ncbi:ABC transporter permease [Pseudoalteromonas fenneropenaei]|uniref:ABC transporter permease n=1 Tax=Pseudoalteromonas fenneropenaei TaxID=1737459 RepID=A0ABV7CJL1_9GAMM
MIKNKVLHIFRHELASKRKSPSLWLLFIMMQLLLAIALFTGWQQFQHSIQTQTTAQALVEEQWQAQPDRHPHRVAHFGHFAFRPPSALSFFDLGVNSWVGDSIFLEAHKQNSANFANDQDGGTLLRFSELSSANILLIIWPLLIIALGFASISGEQKSGTLRQLMAMGVSFRALILGKSLSYLLVSVLFILPVFVFALVLALSSGAEFSAEGPLRLVLLFALYLLYCMFWIGLTLLVSSWVKEPKQALVLLTSIWFIMTILMPRVLAELAHNQHPHQKRNDFELAVKLDNRKVGDSHNPNDPYFNQFREDTLKKYGVATVEELPVNYKGLVMIEGERLNAEVYKKHYAKQLEQFTLQQTFISQFYWLNPYLFVRDFSMALTKTDTKHFLDFEQQAEAHRYTRIQKLNALHTHEIHHHNDREQRISKSFWQEFAPFSYHSPNLSWSLQSFSWRWLLPLLAVALLFIGLYSKGMQRRIYATV